MSVFHGDWNEDPKEFLTLYLQCTAAGDDKFKTRQFINYLGAGSDADEWFDELSQEEKEDWAAIEHSFRKRWLKEEVLSIKETVTTENDSNEPQAFPHSPEIIQNEVFILHKASNTPTSSLTTLSSPTKPKTTPSQHSEPAQASPQPFSPPTPSPSPKPPDFCSILSVSSSQQLKISPPICADTLQLLEIPVNRKNPKICSTNENSPNTATFSLPTSSFTTLDSTEPSTTVTALETSTKITVFAQKLEKLENSCIFSQKTSPTLSPSTFEHTSDIELVYTSLLTHSNVVLKPPTPNTSASTSSPPAAILHEKSDLSRAIFESQEPMESLGSIPIATTLKTRSESSGFMENYQKLENSPFSTQNPSEPLVSCSSNFSIDADSCPASNTIVSDHETRSALTNYIDIVQKVENSPIFTPKAPKPIILERYKFTNIIDLYPKITTIAIAPEKRSETAVFTQKRPKTRKLTLFNQNHLDLFVSGRFAGKYTTELLPTPSIAPTKHPCNISEGFLFLFTKFRVNVL